MSDEPASDATTRTKALRSLAEEDAAGRVLAVDFCKVVAFYATGAVFFRYSETPAWPLLRSLYYITVSIFTVGYGDVVPYSSAGRLFAMPYLLVGIAVIFPIMARLGGYLLTAAEHSFLNRLLRGDAQGAAASRSFSESSPSRSSVASAQLESEYVGNPIVRTRRHRIRFVFSLVLLLIPLFAGSIVLWLLNRSGPQVSSRNRQDDQQARWIFLDALWYSYSTLTTLGYNDLAYQHKQKHRTLLIVFIPCSVIIGTAAISNVARIRRDIREEHKMRQMLDGLNAETIEAMDQNGDGVDKNEFVLFCIKATNLVDIDKIRRFEMLFDDADIDGSGKIDKADLEALNYARSKINDKTAGFYEARFASQRIMKKQSMARRSDGALRSHGSASSSFGADTQQPATTSSSSTGGLRADDCEPSTLRTATLRFSDDDDGTPSTLQLRVHSEEAKSECSFEERITIEADEAVDSHCACFAALPRHNATRL